MIELSIFAGNEPLFAVLGLIVVAVGSFFTLRLTWKRDKVAKEAGIETIQAGSIQAALAGLEALATNVQADNRDLRANQRDQDDEIAALKQTMIDESEACKREIRALAERIASLTIQ